MKKIKVKPEGRKDIYIPDRDSLKGWIKSKKLKDIHNFLGGNSGMLIGADHDLKSVLADIDKADRLAVLLGSCWRQNMKHALSLIFNNELHMYDIGEVTEKDLEITK